MPWWALPAADYIPRVRLECSDPGGLRFSSRRGIRVPSGRKFCFVKDLILRSIPVLVLNRGFAENLVGWGFL